MTVTCAPHGACSSRWRVSAARCAPASPPGATRMLTLARARGISVFDDFAIGVVSMPMTVIAGLAHSRCRHRAGADLGDAVEQPGLLAHPLRRIVDVGRGALVQARHRDVAVVVVQAGQQPHQHAQRVGHHAAPHPRVQAVVERGDLDDAVGQAAQRHRQRRHRRCSSCRSRR